MIDPRAVINAVSISTGVPVERIRGPYRHAQVSRARFVAALVLRWAGWSYPSIGRELGNRDHSTAMHAVRAASADMDLAALAADVAVRCALEPMGVAMETTKSCANCLEPKPLGEFYVGHGTLGRHAWCKDCERARARQYARDHAPAASDGPGRPLRPDELVPCPRCHLRGEHECIGQPSTGMGVQSWV